MKKTGGVKLDKLHIRNRHTCPISHRHAVPRRNPWIGRIQITLSTTPRCQDHHFRRNRNNPLRRTVQHIQPYNTVGPLHLHLFRSDQVDRNNVFPNSDLRRGPNSRQQGLFQLPPRNITRMQHASLAVPCLFS